MESKSYLVIWIKYTKENLSVFKTLIEEITFKKFGILNFDIHIKYKM